MAKKKHAYEPVEVIFAISFPDGDIHRPFKRNLMYVRAFHVGEALQKIITQSGTDESWVMENYSLDDTIYLDVEIQPGFILNRRNG